MSEQVEGQLGRRDRGWKEHRIRQMRRMAQSPLAEKLAWLEEAQKFGEFLVHQAHQRAQSTSMRRS